MKHFRTITSICLTAIAFMVAGNIWYLHSLYKSIKEQTMQTVTECFRRADILEIISRFNHGPKVDDSFIKMTLVVQGEKTPGGHYDYPNILDNLNKTMSQYFHIVEESDKNMKRRDIEKLNILFMTELNSSGLYPKETMVYPFEKNTEGCEGMWSIDFAMADGQSPIYKVCFSPLNGHILRRMSGIIFTSAAILLLMGFLIWYLLYSVGRLRTIEQMKDDFTHNMTHELKTPVAVAYSAADSMLRYYDQSDEARNKQFLNIILKRLSFLSGMIENILSMSMERFKTMKLNIESVKVKSVVEDVAGMMKLKAEKPVEIVVDIPDKLSIQSDTLHLGNILSNLLDNAIKYSGHSVNIVIKANEDCLIIEDNGLGIAKENLPYIFDKFYRVTSGDRYEVGGYGLGLFYVKQIVELHGWNIDVASKPGQGSTFIIRFGSNAER